MKPLSSILLALVLVLGLFGPVFAAPTAQVIPTISIVSVDSGNTVTVRTANYPANDTFTVTMGKFGTRGIGGTQVTTVNSGAGGAQTFTFNIPDALKTERQVAIRLESATSGYYSYNWFYNQTTSPGVPNTGNPGTIPPGTIPTFSIVSVDAGNSVTIRTSNYPANDNFDVLMGKIGTRGVGGTRVTSVSSGTGGEQTFTINIPDALKADRQIAIRLQSPTSGYFSFNWFNNATSSSPGVPTTGGPPAGTIPTITIQSVAADSTVTIATRNYPANDTFTVTMGKFGTQGVGGVSVTSVSSGTGGAQTFTFNIPDSLKGESRIAIRLQSPTSGYYSYNWFWNSTTP
jgi:hypothetical protein